MFAGFISAPRTSKVMLRCTVAAALFAGTVLASPLPSMAQAGADERFPLPVLDNPQDGPRGPAVEPVDGTPPMPAPIGGGSEAPRFPAADAGQAAPPASTEQPKPQATPGQGPSRPSEPIVPPGGAEANLERSDVPASPDETGPAVYYDSRSIPAATSMGRDAGPRKADPRKEPAQKLIVVNKDYGAGSVEAQLVAASRALDLGRYDSAIEMFEALKRRNARDQRILMGLAVAYQKAGRTDGAIQAYQTLLDINPNNVDAKANMLGLIRTKYPAVALRQLLELRDKEPNNGTLAAQIGLTHAELGNFGEAMEYLGMAASMAPGNPLHYYNMAVVADRAGQVEEARSMYERALEVDAVHGNGMLPREVIYDRLSTLRGL